MKANKKLDSFQIRQNVRLEEQLRIEKALREDAEARLAAARMPPPVVAAPVAPPPPPPKTLRQQVDEMRARGDEFGVRNFILANSRGLLAEAEARDRGQAVSAPAYAAPAPAAAPVTVTAPPAAAPPAPVAPALSFRDQLAALPEGSIQRRLFVLSHQREVAAEGDAAIRGAQ